ncbi:unnamed protein product [Camellia sinensis]
MQVEQEAELAEEGTNYPNNSKNLEIEANDQATIPGSDLSYSISVQPEKLDDVNGAGGEPVNSVTAVDSLQEKKKPETNVPNVQIELESETDHKTYNSETGHHAYKSSPEASAKSHVTIPESHGTPSSQASVKAERTKSNSAASKRKSLSAGKMSPTNPDHDSGVRSSLEQLPKERKTGKRRNSFGSARPDNVDQEPRDSNSSNSLPNYMLATESARAKALANSSPRSSPDMQDKEIYIKKRHSLPSANEKHGSPRIHQSTSRAQQGAKGNGHPHGITRQYCVDTSKVVDEINLKFAEAREEIQTTLDSKETVYFDERLLAKLPEKENGAIQRSMGLKIEQLKAELEQLNDY